MVIAIGSMAVKAVFSGAGLLSGLSQTSQKLKSVQQHSKSTTTEMKRMKHGANKLKTALAAIGVGGFAALLMTTPQLAGSLAKIKYEMQQLAWSIGKHLKPALDSVATILQGIRTGDWSTVKQGLEDLTASIYDLFAGGIETVVNVIFGENAGTQARTDFENWCNSLYKSWIDGNFGEFLVTLVFDPLKWSIDRINAYWDNVRAGLKTQQELGQRGQDRSLGSVIEEYIARATGFGKENYESVQGSYQLGGYVPQTGLYQLHAGETVTMKGSSGMSNSNGSSNITIDFSGANINLANGIELDQFADSISKKIAEKQQSLTY